MAGENILITGGAGYIGSHAVKMFSDAGFKVFVLDNLYSGHRWAVDSRADFTEGDASDRSLVLSILKTNKIQAVIHFAGHIVVPESVVDPLKYYGNNSCCSKNLLECCIEAKIDNFIFSSTAAVYGMPKHIPVREDELLNPINPYGTSKLITEWMLRDVSAAFPEFRYVALRYFNVAGASLDGTIGQSTPDATHLIKVASQAACGMRESVDIYGTDYDTPDGTCIRDYIHVEDLVSAHLKALEYLLSGGQSDVFNCGYGKGMSVREILETVKKVSGKDFPVYEKERRAGDSEKLVSDCSKIKEILKWTPKNEDIELICRTAYEWEKKLFQKNKK